MPITTCPNCNRAWDAPSEEAANEPLWASPTARLCLDCFLELMVSIAHSLTDSEVA